MDDIDRLAEAIYVRKVIHDGSAAPERVAKRAYELAEIFLGVKTTRSRVDTRVTSLEDG